MLFHLQGFSALIKPLLTPGFSVSNDHLTIVLPVAVTAALSTYLLTRCFSGQSAPKNRINHTINKDSPKVVHSFDIKDISNRAVYCLCWRSKKFPYCDGAHTKHNEETGDNIGPLIIN